VGPEFSVIVPTRGDSPHLRAALESALRGAEDLELLVVHDRRRGEPPLDAGWQRETRVRLLESRVPGPAGARNAGIDAARGRLVAFLDDDDLWLPEHLRWARETLERSEGAALAANDAFILPDPTSDGSAPLPEDPRSLGRFDPGVGTDAIDLRQMVLANHVLTPTVVARRERLGEERFSPDLAVMEDYDLWLRLAARHPIAWDPRPSVVVRRRSGSASRNLKGMAREGLEVLARLERRGLPPGTVSAGELRRRAGRLWHDLAYACLAEGDLPAARRALRESVARLPLNPKNYMYFLAGTLPGRIRRRIFAA
jgi:glycosyltransferase involved in cell wall biosynthesis